jgi:hypothetical protein
MLKTYSGSCHCGAVTFEAELDLSQGSYRCNCSICRRTRFWPAVATPEHVRISSGAAELAGIHDRFAPPEHFSHLVSRAACAATPR